MRDPRRIMAATVLAFEGLVIFFAALVAKDLTDLGVGRSMAVGGVLAIVCLIASGMLGRRGGYAFGSALQVVVVATGFWLTAMFFVGGLFALLWVVALRTGGRLEADLARRQAASGPSQSS